MSLKPSAACYIPLAPGVNAKVFQSVWVPESAKNELVVGLVASRGVPASWGYLGGIDGTDCCGACTVVCLRCPDFVSVHALLTAFKHSIFRIIINDKHVQYQKYTYLQNAITEFSRRFDQCCSITLHKEGDDYILVNDIKDPKGFNTQVIPWVFGGY